MLLQVYVKRLIIKDSKKGDIIMNRHIIIRAVLAAIWVIVGIVVLIKGQMTSGLISLAMGAAFGFSAFSMSRKK